MTFKQGDLYIVKSSFLGSIQPTETYNDKIDKIRIYESEIKRATRRKLMERYIDTVDEAEEIPDYETFKKVFYSIRSEQKRNLTILILVPLLGFFLVYFMR